jgi:subfamily B ATP-binding cassette protein MsbA
MTDAINRTTRETEQYRAILQKDFGLTHVSRNDIIRYRLYQELAPNGYKTLYSNQYIPQEKLFSKDIDIEHIIPQSRLFDDSFSNKTLEYRDINIEKSNATAIDYVNERQQRQNAFFTSRRIAIYRRIYAASPLSDLVGNIIVVAILIVGAANSVAAASPTAMPPALFVSYIMIYVLLLTPIKDFSNAIAQLKKGRGVEERIAEACTEAVGQPGVQQPAGPIDSIELRNVAFSYGDNKVFDNLSLSIPMHCHTAITGPSGSGKTTMGRMLVGLLRPQSGAVLVNGHPATAGRIAYIPQEPMLFNGTIEANIRFGRQWVSDDDIARAVEIAQVEPILQVHPDGLQTNIGDGGTLLSGGERQRVNIARALAANPDVIVMDEATAALDAATEQHFSQSLRRLSGRTLIVIAHRASTIAGCDVQLNLDALQTT